MAKPDLHRMREALRSRPGSWIPFWIGALILVGGSAFAQDPHPPSPSPAAFADTAAVVLGIAGDLEDQGRVEEARFLLQYIIGRWPGSEAAHLAQDLLSGHDLRLEMGRGETQFITWNTAFAAWLGIAIPLAMGSEDAAAYGAALLLAPPTGFFASRSYARSHGISQGQAGAYLWATVWGTWQAIGWREALDLGEKDSCYDYGYGLECYPSEPENAGVKAALVGGLVGVAGGLILVNQDIRAGDAALVSHASVWGTFYGFAIGGMADLENDDLLTAALVAGNIGLVGAIPAARAISPTRGRVALMSAAGLAGGLAGIGVDLLVQPDEDKVIILIPTAGVTVGLFTGALLTRRTDWKDESSFDAAPGSLLSMNDGVRFGLPLPRPGIVTTLDRNARRKRLPSIEIRLAELSF